MTHRVAMAANGRLVIPATVRSELGMQDGGNFIVHVKDGHIPGFPNKPPGGLAEGLIFR
jgi:AbrB family looped-hinge helix DNA binding protein